MVTKAHINLFQPELFEGRPRKRGSIQKRLFPFLAGILLFLFAGFYIQEGKKEILLRKEIEQIQRQRDQLRQQMETLAAASSPLDRMKTLGDPMSADPGLTERVPWSRLLQEVSWVVPEEVWITELEKEMEQGIRFSGFALSSQKVTHLMASLEKSSYFQDVLLEYTRQSPGDRKVDFSIHARLKREAFKDTEEAR